MNIAVGAFGLVLGPLFAAGTAGAVLMMVIGMSLVGLVYLVLIGSLVGYTAYVWLLGHVAIGTVATYAYVNPVVAILLGVIFLDERVTWQIAVGALVVLASVALVIRNEAARVVEPFAE